MRYRVLAADYDSTLATEGIVPPEVTNGLRRVRTSGRRLVLVTGRQLGDVMALFPDIAIFDRVVAENGAVLFEPGTTTEVALAPAPPAAFLSRLRGDGVVPLATGRVVVATLESQQTKVLRAIRELGLDLHMILNRDSLMVLPANIDKATGLQRALADVHEHAGHVVAIGDAENDVPFLKSVALGVAVGNAVPILKEAAHVVTRSERGEGVLEVIEMILGEDGSNLRTSGPGPSPPAA